MQDSKTFWRGYSTVYDQLLEILPYRNLLLEVVDHARVNSDMTLLDVCCGTGNLLWSLEQRGISCEVLGLDYSKPMLAIAASKAGGYSGRASFRMADINDGASLASLSRKFDRIICNNNLFLFRDPEEILRRLNSVAEDGAIIVASLPRPNPSLNELLEEHLWLAEAGGQPRELVMQQLQPLLRSLIKHNKALFEWYSTAHFPSECQLRSWFEKSGWTVTGLRTAYANQNWLIIAEKSISV